MAAHEAVVHTLADRRCTAPPPYWRGTGARSRVNARAAGSAARLSFDNPRTGLASKSKDS